MGESPHDVPPQFTEYELQPVIEQVGRIERDITGAIEARLHFLDFARNYPGSPHMPEPIRRPSGARSCPWWAG